MKQNEKSIGFCDADIVLRANEDEVSFADIVRALQSAGVRSGDVVMVHSSLFQLGRPADLTNRNAVPDAFVQAFNQVLGPDGTLLVPTFTYSFCGAETFNVQTSPTRMGVLAERVRQHADSIRSVQPLFSAAGFGARAREVIEDVGKSSFGKDSVFDRLHRMGSGKYLVLGEDLWVLTAIHHIEQAFGVPYRYLKEFTGTIVDGDRTYTDTFDYLVRNLDLKAKSCLHEVFADHLRRAGKLQETTLGGGFVRTVNEVDLYTEAVKFLGDNDRYFLTDMDRNPIALERVPVN